MKNPFKMLFRSLMSKIILLTTLLLMVIIGFQTFFYVGTEIKNMENVLIQNKEDFVRLLAINFGAAQSVGGFAFQSQLIEESIKTKDTLFVRFVNPSGEIYLSSLQEDKGKIVRDDAVNTTQTIVKDTVYNGEDIKVVVSPSPGGYTTWLGFSQRSIAKAATANVFSRMAMAGAILLLGVLGSIFLALGVTKNIRILKDTAEEITRGNLKAKANIKSEDEIGRLAESFNHMTDKLLTSRNNLEKKVKELSEEHGRMSSLVESVKLGVVMVDLSLNVILANSAAKKIVGKTQQKDFTFKELSDKIKGDIDISQALSYYVKSGKPLNVQEAMIGERYFRFFMSPVRDIIDKMFVGAVMVMEDITEEKKIDKMRREIISITSHQLRTPSTIVKGNLEMLMSGSAGDMNDMQKELLNDTYLGNKRMIRLINDLMDAAKIEGGELKMPLEPAQLENVVGEVIKNLETMARDKKVTLTYDRPSSEFSPVKINVQRMSQVIQNIVDNAIKYSSANSNGKVDVSIIEGVKFLELVVKDNGIGIPEDEQNKIFERFSRGSNSTKLDPGGGSGLGLYIAKAVMEQGGGDIWFESKENEGTVFHVTFPYN